MDGHPRVGRTRRSRGCGDGWNELRRSAHHPRVSRPGGKPPSRCRARARRRSLVHGATIRRARLARPEDRRTRHTALGEGSAPHGVIVGPDGAPWITDGGLNAIVRVDPKTLRVRRFPLPASSPGANLNTATFDRHGILWFTGQSGIYGRLDPRSGKVRVFAAPRGPGPVRDHGDTVGRRLLRLARRQLPRPRGRRAFDRPRPPAADRDQGARRAWSDSKGRIWVSEWNAGKVAMYAPATGRWREWRLPGASPMPYAVYVDETDTVWLSDFGANALVRFDPRTEKFTRIGLPSSPANVRQILGRRGEVWGAESGVDKLVVIRTS